MRFFALHEGYYEGVQLRIDQFAAACKKLDIEFYDLDSLRLNYTNLPGLVAGDMLYNLSRGSSYAEYLLINDAVTTFYINKPVTVSINSDTVKYSIVHEQHGLPQPKTIYAITDERTMLKKYMEYLGGFPLIIKSVGSTRGLGTIKIDSWQNLVSTIDYLITTGGKFIMRQFIKAKSGCRLTVAGNEMVAGADFTMNHNDFRNAAVLNEVKYYNREYPDYLKALAVKATHLANVEFAGVDFLEDEDGNYYLLEVNFPTGFSSLIDVCGVDIPYKAVEHLYNKSNDLITYP